MALFGTLAKADATAASTRRERLVEMAGRLLRAEGDRDKTRLDAVFAFTVRVASAGILYLSQVLLARWMGGHEYGIYVSVWTWILVLGGLSHLGMNMAMIRLVPEYSERGEHDLLRGLLRGGRVFAFALASLIAVLGLIFLTLYGDLVAKPYLMPAFLVLFCLPMYVLGDVQDGIGRGRAWMGVALLPIYILRPLTLLLVMIVAHELGAHLDARMAAGAAIIATWTATMVQSLILHSRLTSEIPAGPRRYDFKGWLAAALPLLVIGFSEIVLQNADILIVASQLSPDKVGIYFAAAKTMSLIMFVHYAVGSAVANRFATLHARGDRQALEAFVRDAVRWTFWPSLAGAMLILALGWPLLSLFGPGFTEGYPVMFVLAAGFLVRASFGPAEFLLNMLGEQKICALVAGLAALSTVALNLLLVPRFGIMGAATATAVTLVGAALANWLVTRRRLGLQTSILFSRAAAGT